MPDCNACGEELSTSQSHNWRCENEDCVQYHRGHRDMQESDSQECHRCGGDGYWRGDLYQCEDCGRTWA